MINYENRVKCDGGFSESFNWEKFNYCDHLMGMIELAFGLMFSAIHSSFEVENQAKNIKAD